MCFMFDLNNFMCFNRENINVVFLVCDWFVIIILLLGLNLVIFLFLIFVIILRGK